MLYYVGIFTFVIFIFYYCCSLKLTLFHYLTFITSFRLDIQYVSLCIIIGNTEKSTYFLIEQRKKCIDFTIFFFQ